MTREEIRARILAADARVAAAMAAASTERERRAVMDRALPKRKTRGPSLKRKAT
jgi:hypothetical protein